MSKQLRIFGKNVKKLRENKNISLKQLSQMSGITENYLKKIENAQAKKVNISHVEILADCFNVNLKVLFIE